MEPTLSSGSTPFAIGMVRWHWEYYDGSKSVTWKPTLSSTYVDIASRCCTMWTRWTTLQENRLGDHFQDQKSKISDVENRIAAGPGSCPFMMQY